MKRLFTLAACAAIALNSYAQKDKGKSVETKYLQLPLYDVSTTDPASVKAEFAAGEGIFGKEKMKDTKSTCVPKGGGLKDAMEVTTYYYELPYTAPSSYLVAKDASGNILYAVEVSGSKQDVKKFGYDECKYWVAETMKKDWAKKKESFKSSSDRSYASARYEDAKQLAKLNVFPAYIDEEFDVFTGKGRKHSYEDLDKAFDLAMNAYESIGKEGPNDGSSEKLRSAIAIWEKALEEKDLEDKKARISKDVCKGLYENLGNAYMYLFEFDKALENAREAQSLWGNFSTNRSQEWDQRTELMSKRKRAAEMNQSSMENLDELKKKVEAAGRNSVAVNQLDASEFTRLQKEYNTYRVEQGSAKREALEKEYDEAVASGEVNPYQKYVQETATQGKMIMMTPLTMAPELTEFPKEICEITDLKQVMIMNNKIASVPSEIGKLKDLEKLDLKGNKITSLPKEIGELTNLKTLDLSNNPITEIPDEIKNCTSLKKVKVKGTKLSKDQISKLGSLLPDAKIKD